MQKDDIVADFIIGKKMNVRKPEAIYMYLRFNRAS